MGPDNLPPVRLFFINEETGEKTELPTTIKEFSFTETGDDEPMYLRAFLHWCDYLAGDERFSFNPNDTKEGL